MARLKQIDCPSYFRKPDSRWGDCAAAPRPSQPAKALAAVNSLAAAICGQQSVGWTSDAAVRMISGMPDPDILIMTVGRGNDARRVDTLYESMRKSMGQGHWRRIILLPSADTAALADELCTYVERNHNERLHIEVGPRIPADEHEDEDLCFAHFDRILERLIHGGEDPANMVFDYTRGTKAMSAAAVLACVSRGVEKIRYVSGKRGPDGNIIPGTESPRDGHTSVAVFRRELDRAKTLLVSGHFEQARLNLSELAGLPPEARTPAQTEAWKRALGAIRPHRESSRPRRELTAEEAREVKSGLQLACFWGAWDRFYYREAAGLASRLGDVHPFWKRAAPLPGNIEAIHRLAQEVPSRPKEASYVGEFQKYARSLVGVHQRLAADLIQNAWRRWWSGECEDTLIRAFRAQELVGHLHLCRRGILASNLCVEDPEVNEWLTKGGFRGGPIKLYHRNELAKPMVASLLTFLDDEWFRDHARDKWKELQSRNQSPLTHGLECQATAPESLAELLHEVEHIFVTEDKENAGLLVGSCFPVPEIKNGAQRVS